MHIADRFLLSILSYNPVCLCKSYTAAGLRSDSESDSTKIHFQTQSDFQTWVRKYWLWFLPDQELTAFRPTSDSSLENVDSDLGLIWSWLHPNSKSELSLENVGYDLGLIWKWYHPDSKSNVSLKNVDYDLELTWIWQQPDSNQTRVWKY